MGTPQGDKNGDIPGWRKWGTSQGDEVRGHFRATKRKHFGMTAKFKGKDFSAFGSVTMRLPSQGLALFPFL
jgi:hypothetical protein